MGYIQMSEDNFNEFGLSSGGLKRRDLLKTVAAGTGLGFLPSVFSGQGLPRRPPHKPPPYQLHTGQTGVLQWTDALQEPAMAVTGSVYYNGIVAIASQGSEFSTVIASNIHDGPVTWNAPTISGSYGPPVGVAGNIIASVNNGGSIGLLILGTTIQAGTISPAQPVSNLLSINGNTLIYVDVNGNLVAIQITTANSYTTLWSGSTGLTTLSGVFVQSASSALVAVVNQNGNLVIMNVTGGTPQVLFSSQFQNPQLPNGAAGVDGSAVYIPTGGPSSPQMTAISLATGSPLWTLKLSALPGTPVSYNGLLYFVDANGAFRAVSTATGTQAWTSTLDGGTTGALFIEDGIAYICTSSGKLYGIDLASQGVNTVLYDFSQGGLASATYLLGVENGICFVLNQNGAAISGVDLAGQVHGFSCDSTLMADNYVAGASGSPQGAAPSYRSVIQLVDSNKNPRAFKNIRVEASDVVTIVSGGQTYSLNPSDSFYLTTDANGTLNMVSTAADVQSPALYLWGDFMARGESLVIYPDHDTINTLAAAQNTDYQNATAFDGSSLLPSTADPGQVAQTVANTLGAGIPAVPPSPNPYSSYPGSATNLSFQSTQGVTARAYMKGNAQSFTTTIDPDTGAVAFSTGVSATQGPLLGFSLSDFKKDIVNGEKKIAKIACTVGNTVAHEITAVTGEIYNFTVNAVEDAVNVVTGFLKSILGAVEKAVEWLSYVFDWAAIKQTQAQVKGFVTNAQAQVRAYLNTDAAAIKVALHNFFQGIEGTILQNIANINTAIGSQSLQSKQQNGNDPKAAYNANGTHSYAPSSSMTSKVTDNQQQATMTSPSSSGPLSLAAVKSLAEGLWTSIPGALGPTLQLLKTALDEFVASFGLLTSNPSEFITHAFGDILTILGDAAVLVLQSVDLVLDLVIGSIADLLDSLVSVILGNFHIPIVSDIFQLVFGTPLTFLDLVAWLVAIPATIVSRAVGVKSTVLGAQPGLQNWLAFFSTSFGGAFDALNDAISPDADSPLSVIDLAMACCTFALTVPSSFNGNDPAICYYAFGCVPIIISFTNFVLTFTESEIAAGFNESSYLLDGTYGIFNMLVAIVNAFSHPAEFSDPDYLVLCQNIFSNTGLVCKDFYLGAKEVTVTTDVVCPVTAAGIGLAVAFVG
jgi:hypothetical protein